jgi:hypothetical protein
MNLAEPTPYLTTIIKAAVGLPIVAIIWYYSDPGIVILPHINVLQRGGGH